MLEKTTINRTQFPIESLLSARLLLEPQIEGNRIYFLSDLAGTLSLYSITSDGSIPQPMLPGGLALVNPHIMPGDNFHVLPKLVKVLVMIDKLGDENYQPNLIPLSGGIPEPLFGDKYRGEQIACVNCDKEKNIAYFFRDNRKTPDIECLKVNLETGEVRSLGTSIYGNACNGVSSDHSTVILADGYTAGDVVLYYWKEGMAARKLLYGVPLDQRDGKQVPLTGIGWCSFVDNNKGLFFESNIFHDDGGLTYLSLDDPSKPVDVPIEGLRHSGQGEMTGVRGGEGRRVCPRIQYRRRFMGLRRTISQWDTSNLRSRKNTHRKPTAIGWRSPGTRVANQERKTSASGVRLLVHESQQSISDLSYPDRGESYGEASFQRKGPGHSGRVSFCWRRCQLHLV